MVYDTDYTAEVIEAKIPFIGIKNARYLAEYIIWSWIRNFRNNSKYGPVLKNGETGRTAPPLKFIVPTSRRLIKSFLEKHSILPRPQILAAK